MALRNEPGSYSGRAARRTDGGACSAAGESGPQSNGRGASAHRSRRESRQRRRIQQLRRAVEHDDGLDPGAQWPESMRQRGPVTTLAGSRRANGKKLYISKQLRGGKRDAERELAHFVTQVEEGTRTAVSGAIADLCEKWFELHGGELLPDDPYEKWASERRELLRLRHLSLLRVANHER